MNAVANTEVADAVTVVVVADAHTVSDRPHLRAEQVIEHHHWIWTNLISAIPVRLLNESEL